MTADYRSGSIWRRDARSRAQVVRRVCEGLELEYGQPRLGNPQGVLDDLVYIMMSNKTSPKVARRTYEQAKSEYANWDEVLASSRQKLRHLLEAAGLANVRSKQIYSTLLMISADVGTCDLEFLHSKTTEEVHDYLTSLPGVSDKVARCVMLFALGMEVLPVDSHVHRIASRLGWTSRNRPDQCHGELEALIPPWRRYAFHVGCISHGRAVCRPRDPMCDKCSISRHCSYYRFRSR